MWVKVRLTVVVSLVNNMAGGIDRGNLSEMKGETRKPKMRLFHTTGTACGVREWGKQVMIFE